ELDLVLDALGRVPPRDGLDVGRIDGLAVLVAEQVLEQNPERVGQGFDVADLGPDERIQAIQRELGVADGDLGLAAEAVGRHGSLRNLTVWGYRGVVVVSEREEVAEVAAAIARAPLVAFDLEFVSADRLVPVLCLIQIAWVDALDAAEGVKVPHV